MSHNSNYIRIGIEQLIDRAYPKLATKKNINVRKGECKPELVDVSLSPYNFGNPNYGQINVSQISLPVYIHQKTNNIGLYDNADYFSFSDDLDDSLPIRGAGDTIDNYVSQLDVTVIGFTQSRLSEVKSYNRATPYIRNLNLSDRPSDTFTGVLDLFSNKIVYVIGGDVDSSGGYVDGTGILYTYDTISDETTFEYKLQGITDELFDIYAIYQRDYNHGLAEPPRVSSDILVDRNSYSVFETHLRLEEINTLESLEDSLFYNING